MRVVEIISEFLLLLVCAFIQQLMVPQELEAQEKIEIAIFTSFGLLIVFNAYFVISSVVTNRKDKKRLKAREKRRLEWEEAMKAKKNKGDVKNSADGSLKVVQTSVVRAPLQAISEESMSHSS